MNKTNVNVECNYLEAGVEVPRVIIWNDGRKWIIDRVTHSCSSKYGEYEGIRYTVIIGNAERYLYKYGSQWYVNSC